MITTPCSSCPFLKDNLFLHYARAREIAAALRRGGMFPCHKTTSHGEDEHGESITVTTKDSLWCAGALATMENEDGPGAMQNQIVRIASRLRLLDLDRLDGKDRVFPSLAAWVKAHAKLTR